MTKDSPAVRLRNLTDPADVRECHKHNFHAWGQTLTLEQYLQREKVFGSQPSTANGNLTYWGLQEQQPQGWKSVCAMETLRRPALYKRKGQPIAETISHSIGAVYTPEENRGKGYASKMMDLGVKTLDDWQMHGVGDKSTTFSVLWSDVGDYYSRFGYQVTNSNELKFELEYESGQSVSWPEGVEKIGMDDIEKLAAQDEHQLRKIMERDTESDGISRVAVIPQAIIHYTSFQRALYLSKFMSKVESAGAPSVFGARYNNCWMLWTQDFSADKLTSLRLYAELDMPRDQVAEACNKLLLAGLCEAQKWKFGHFTVWEQDVPEQLNANEMLSFLGPQPGVKDAQFYNRSTSWPMVRFHGNSDETMKWIYDGKYGWF